MSGNDSLTHADVSAAYARWAPFYDLAFNLVMRAGRLAVARAVNHAGGRVLDLGVGTGLELPMFASRVRVTGIDLSEPMLRICQKRVRERRLAQVDGLAAMDAMQLAFSDGVFDVAVAPYVLTVVPDPRRTLDELMRVVKPGGEIILVNHIGADSGLIAWAEERLARRSAALGWRPSFPWSIIEDWLAVRSDATMVERRALSPFGLFTLVRISRH